MIDFPCTRCGKAYSVPADLAGTDFQCTACGLLLSVPLPSDLANLNADGTFHLSAESPKHEAERIETLARLFGSQKFDEDGEAFDNRTLPEILELAPIEPVAVKVAPAYDPETGELVRQIQLAPPLANLAPPPGSAAAAALAGPPTLAYRAMGSAIHDEGKRVGPGQVWVDLFQPMNVFVMSAVLLAHVIINLIMVVVFAGMIFVIVGPLLLFILIVGHYGNVVDEIGPTDKDELPRPLRDFSWSEDLWGPFRDVFASLMLAGSPTLLYAWIVYKYELEGPWVGVAGWVALALTAVTFVLQPALLLTLRTSGSLVNLRPDRVVGVVRTCGRRYWAVLALGLAATAIYYVGWVGTAYTIRRWLSPAGITDYGWLGNVPVTYGALMIGIYLWHLYAWQLGLLYRAYQPKFPWVDQQYQGSRLRQPYQKLSAAERAARMAARRAANPPARRPPPAVESLGSRQHL